MVEYSATKYNMEFDLRTYRINKNYPIIFNRVNWNEVESNMKNLCEFQKEQNIVIPETFRPLNPGNDPEGRYNNFYKKIDEILYEDPKKRELIGSYRNSEKRSSYDDVYEFIKNYPEWNKLVFYDKNYNNIYDEFLTIHQKNYPIKFNKINWKYVDQIISKLYKLTVNEEKPIIPYVLFMFKPKGMSETYYNISYKIYKFYESEAEKGNKNFEEWKYYEDNAQRNGYDNFYEFIMAYPEFSDIVYFDPGK